MVLYTLAGNYQKAMAANAASTSFTAKNPTLTAPTGAGFHDLLSNGSIVSSVLFLQPYGSDANDETFDMRVWGWRKLKLSSSDYWVPVLMLELNCTLGNTAATDLGTSNFLCDTIVRAKGDDTSRIVSPANDLPGYVMLDLAGVAGIEFDFDLTGAASANALWANL